MSVLMSALCRSSMSLCLILHTVERLVVYLWGSRMPRYYTGDLVWWDEKFKECLGSVWCLPFAERSGPVFQSCGVKVNWSRELVIVAPLRRVVLLPGWSRFWDISPLILKIQEYIYFFSSALLGLWMCWDRDSLCPNPIQAPHLRENN